MYITLVFFCVYVEIACCHPQPETDELIGLYHRMGKLYQIIPSYLFLFHGIHISYSWLKRRLRFLGLKRKGIENHSTIQAARLAIRVELVSSNSHVGYRTMWQILKLKHNIHIKRETVRLLLSHLDPDGTAQRKKRRLHRRIYINKGPNFVWHVDGYDKLSSYGLHIHGCIDGFSRRIMWLELVPSNHNPCIVASLFLDAVANCGGCPTIVRSDCGTENCGIATIQMSLRHFHSDKWKGTQSFKYGKSSTNTRIEGLWAIFRRQKSGWWIDKFKKLVAEGILNPASVEHRYCIAYVYGPLLRRDLEEFVMMWNNHRMRLNRNAYCPPGVPDDLYYFPEHNGTTNYLQLPVDHHVFTEAARQYYLRVPPMCPTDFEVVLNALLLESMGIGPQDINLTNCDNVCEVLCSFLE